MTSSALDTAALALLQAMARADTDRGARARHGVDDAVRALHALVARRIQWLVVRHGLAEMGDDAEQACLMALVDAARRWDPDRSSFATWLGWHLRGVLAGLRRQWLGDHRTAAGRQRAATQSLDGDMAAQLPSDWLMDPTAEMDVTRAAADWLAVRCANRLAADCSETARTEWVARLIDDAERSAPLPAALRRRH